MRTAKPQTITTGYQGLTWTLGTQRYNTENGKHFYQPHVKHIFTF